MGESRATAADQDANLTALGFTDEVVNMIQGSRAMSTKAQYKPQWNLFIEWCESNGLNPRQASVPLLTRFLLHLFNERNLSIRTIKNFLSALAYHWLSSVGYEIPSEERHWRIYARAWLVSDRYQ